MKLEIEKINFKIPYCRMVFKFSCKTSVFCGAGCFFGELFCQFLVIFFMQNFSFWRGWEVFFSKKRHFFSCKTSVFEGLSALFGNFFVDFLAFFLNVPAPPQGERAKRARLTRDDDSRCTPAGRASARSARGLPAMLTAGVP